MSCWIGMDTHYVCPGFMFWSTVIFAVVMGIVIFWSAYKAEKDDRKTRP